MAPTPRSFPGPCHSTQAPFLLPVCPKQPYFFPTQPPFMSSRPCHVLALARFRSTITWIGASGSYVRGERTGALGRTQHRLSPTLSLFSVCFPNMTMWYNTNHFPFRTNRRSHCAIQSSVVGFLVAHLPGNKYSPFTDRIYHTTSHVYYLGACTLSSTSSSASLTIRVHPIGSRIFRSCQHIQDGVQDMHK